MIFAELHGKLGQHHSRAHERAEDVLTSTVFGMLRYLPVRDWLPLLAARIRPIGLDAVSPVLPDAAWLDVGDVERCEQELWKMRHPHGEPDVLLSLYDGQSRLRHLVIIEVKLYSPKSGSAHIVEPIDGKSDEEEIAGIDDDQLVRYWRYLEEAAQAPARRQTVAGGSPGPAISLVYLTAHTTPPLDELMISRKAVEGEMRLGWLSWFDVWEVVRKLSAKSLPAHDLERLLSHKGFRRFTGFREQPTQAAPRPAATASFWRKRDWFRQTEAVTAGSSKFWQG